MQQNFKKLQYRNQIDRVLKNGFCFFFDSRILRMFCDASHACLVPLKTRRGSWMTWIVVNHHAGIEGRDP